MDTMLKLFYILTFGMAIFTVKTGATSTDARDVATPPDAACVNNDTTADWGNDTCTSYYDHYPSKCGKYDTDLFNASVQCCACKALTKDSCKQDFGAFGPCEAFIKRYSYNATANKCQEFVWGGCEGNNNRFPSWLECHHICMETKGDSIATKPREEGQNCYDFGLEKGGCGKNLICTGSYDIHRRHDHSNDHSSTNKHMKCQKRLEEGQICYDFGLEKGGCDKNLVCGYDDHRHPGKASANEHMLCLAPRKEGEECNTMGLDKGGCGRGLKCVTIFLPNWWWLRTLPHACYVPKKRGDSCDMFADDCGKDLHCAPIDAMFTQWSCINWECALICGGKGKKNPLKAFDCMKTMCASPEV